ncbi:hypothetical protein JKP88DRAFT_255041 [Tribonema minus]|uniref:Uncharacterized protein n=1 Tax=Tribonema minus TaxID=303371 RepID=A0A835ZA99_9STRA|nr:hypothetical protein JKP88DRAFT_255041 [Tribonema minus]
MEEQKLTSVPSGTDSDDQMQLPLPRRANLLPPLSADRSRNSSGLSGLDSSNTTVHERDRTSCQSQLSEIPHADHDIAAPSDTSAAAAAKPTPPPEGLPPDTPPASPPPPLAATPTAEHNGLPPLPNPNAKRPYSFILAERRAAQEAAAAATLKRAQTHGNNWSNTNSSARDSRQVEVLMLAAFLLSARASSAAVDRCYEDAVTDGLFGVHESYMQKVHQMRIFLDTTRHNIDVLNYLNAPTAENAQAVATLVDFVSESFQHTCTRHVAVTVPDVNVAAMLSAGTAAAALLQMEFFSVLDADKRVLIAAHNNNSVGAIYDPELHSVQSKHACKIRVALLRIMMQTACTACKRALRQGIVTSALQAAPLPVWTHSLLAYNVLIAADPPLYLDRESSLDQCRRKRSRKQASSRCRQTHARVTSAPPRAAIALHDADPNTMDAAVTPAPPIGYIVLGDIAKGSTTRRISASLEGLAGVYHAHQSFNMNLTSAAASAPSIWLTDSASGLLMMTSRYGAGAVAVQDSTMQGFTPFASDADHAMKMDAAARDPDADRPHINLIPPYRLSIRRFKWDGEVDAADSGIPPILMSRGVVMTSRHTADFMVSQWVRMALLVLADLATLVAMTWLFLAPLEAMGRRIRGGHSVDLPFLKSLTRRRRFVAAVAALALCSLAQGVNMRASNARNLAALVADRSAAEAGNVAVADRQSMDTAVRILNTMQVSTALQGYLNTSSPSAQQTAAVRRKLGALEETLSAEFGLLFDAAGAIVAANGSAYAYAQLYADDGVTGVVRDALATGARYMRSPISNFNSNPNHDPKLYADDGVMGVVRDALTTGARYMRSCCRCAGYGTLAPSVLPATPGSKYEIELWLCLCQHSAAAGAPPQHCTGAATPGSDCTCPDSKSPPKVPQPEERGRARARYTSLFTRAKVVAHGGEASDAGTRLAPQRTDSYTCRQLRLRAADRCPPPAGPRSGLTKASAFQAYGAVAREDRYYNTTPSSALHPSNVSIDGATEVLTRWAACPVWAGGPRAGGAPSGVLVTGSAMNSKTRTAEIANRMSAHGYTAVYYRTSAGAYQMATGIMRRADGAFDVDVPMPETGWLDALRDLDLWTRDEHFTVTAHARFRRYGNAKFVLSARCLSKDTVADRFGTSTQLRSWGGERADMCKGYLVQGLPWSVVVPLLGPSDDWQWAFVAMSVFKLLTMGFLCYRAYQPFSRIIVRNKGLHPQQLVLQYPRTAPSGGLSWAMNVFKKATDKALLLQALVVVCLRDSTGLTETVR